MFNFSLSYYKFIIIMNLMKKFSEFYAIFKRFHKYLVWIFIFNIVNLYSALNEVIVIFIVQIIVTFVAV